MNRENKDIDGLFRKYLSGNCSPQDLDELLNHFKVTDPDQLMMAIRRQFDSNTSEDIDKDKVDAITACAHIELMRQIKPKSAYQPTKLWRRIAVAAITLLAIGIAIYHFNAAKEEQVILTSKFGSDVLPGGNRAQITFSNGESLALDSTQSELIIKNGKYIYADGKELKASKATYATVNTPVGGMYQLLLSDGTKVWLNAQSSVKYPSVFANHERTIEISGEVYLEVASDNKKPFVVKTQKQRIEVLGTAFNIREYGENSITTLTHGKIKLSIEDDMNSIFLNPGQQAVLSNGILSTTNVKADEYTAWMDGIILQRNVTLLETCEELERWYNIKFKFSPNYQNRERAFHIINRNEMLSSVLAALQNTYNVHFEIKGKEVLVK